MSNARLISSVALSLIAFLLSVWQTAIFVSQNSLTSTKAFFVLVVYLEYNGNREHSFRFTDS